MMIEELWNRSLPPWTDDSPRRLLALFASEAWARPGPAREELAVLLMHLITFQFERRATDWPAGLLRVGLRTDDVASITLAHLLHKAPVLWGPLRDKIGDQHKVLLRGLYSTIIRRVLQEVASRRRRRVAEIPATDCLAPTSRKGVIDPPHEIGAFGGIAAPVPGDHDDGDPSALHGYLCALEDDVVGDIPVRGERTVVAVSEVYELLVDGLARGRGIVPYRDLPRHLHRDVHSSLHLLVAGRLVRLVRKYAEG